MRIVAGFFILAAFLLGLSLGKTAQAAQTVKLYFLPPTDPYNNTTLLFNGFGHAPSYDANGLDWDSPTSDPNIYLRYIGISSDTSPRARALFKVREGSLLGCSALIVDIYSAQTGTWMASPSYVHYARYSLSFWGVGVIRFKNGNGELISGIDIGDYTYPDPLGCGTSGSHVHETHVNGAYSMNRQPDGSYYGDFVCPPMCPDYREKPNFDDPGTSGVQNYTRSLLWNVTSDPNVPHKLVAQHSGKCLQPVGGATSNGTHVAQYTCSTTNLHQQLGLINLQNGYYAVVFLYSGRCLEVLNYETYLGAPLGIWDCYDGPNQQWSGPFTYGQPLLHYSAWMGSTYETPGYMSIPGSSMSNGAELVQWWWPTTTNFQFKKY